MAAPFLRHVRFPLKWSHLKKLIFGANDRICSVFAAFYKSGKSRGARNSFLLFATSWLGRKKRWKNKQNCFTSSEQFCRFFSFSRFTFAARIVKLQKINNAQARQKPFPSESSAPMAPAHRLVGGARKSKMSLALFVLRRYCFLNNKLPHFSL